MVTTKLNLSMTEPQVRQIYAKQGDTGRVLDISLDQTPEDGTLRILRPDGTEVTSEAVTGGEVSESGETVTFESMTEADVTELTVGIEPVQDLNGYDAPWVGGAGVNLYDGSLIYFNADSSATSLNGITLTKNADGSFRVRGTASAETRLNVNYTDSFAVASYAFSVRGITGSGLRIILQGNPSSAGIAYTSVYPTSDWSQVYSVTESSTLNYFFLDVQNGATIDFTLKVQIEKGSTATAWQPYSNICPIYGGNETNLCPTFTSGTRSGLTYTVNEDGSVHVTGTCTGTTFWAVQFTLPKGTYVLSGAPSNGQLTIRNAEGGGAPSSAFSGTLDDYGNSATFTVSETATAWLNIRTTAGTHDKMYFPMIRLASVSSPYVPYQSVRVTETGKNLLPKATSGTASNVTYTVHDDGTITANGTSNGWQPFAVGTATLPSGQYYGTTGITSFGTYMEWVVNGRTFNTSSRSKQPFTLTQAEAVTFKMYTRPNEVADNLTLYPMVYLQSETDDTYVPFGNTYTTSLGQTVYGGTLDMVSGVLTVTHRFITIDENTSIGKESASWNPNNNIFYHELGNGANKGKWGSTTVSPNIVSNYCSAVSYSTILNTSESYKVALTARGRYIDWSAPFTSVADMKTFLASNPLEFCYELATPTEYDLTPQQIKTLVGTNNVWASSGDIISITFTYGGLLSELPSEATSVVGKCYCDVEQNGVSSMPFTLNVKKNERES